MRRASKQQRLRHRLIADWRGAEGAPLIDSPAVAIGEIVQCGHHMRTAIQQGASPREVLEVLLQSVLVVGHPNVVPERIRDLVAIVKDLGLKF